MKSKINFSILLAIFPVVFVAGAVLFFAQNSGAQIDIEACQSEYSKRRNQCMADDNVCSAPCRELPQGDVDVLARCYAPCNEKRNACDEAAVDWQRKCAGVWPYNQPADQGLPEVKVQPQAPKSSAASSQPQKPQKNPLPKNPKAENKKDNTANTDTNLEVKTDPEKLAKFRAAVEQEAKQIKSIKECQGPTLPSQNPCVAEKLDFITLKPREKYLKMSFLDSSPVTEPIIIGQQGDIEVLDFSQTSAADVSFDSFPVKINLKDFQKFFPIETPPNSGLEWRMSTQGAADMKSGESGAWEKIRFQTKAAPGAAAVATDKNPVVVTAPGGKTALEIGPQSVVEIAPDLTLTSGPPAQGTKGAGEFITTFVHTGAVKVDKGGGESVLIQTPLTETKSKHTKFAVLYNAEEMYAATVVYEGEVEVTNVLNGLTATITPNKDGKPRAIIVPLEKDQQLPAARTQAQRFLIFVLPALLLAVFGYLTYRYKKAVAARTAKLK